MRPTATSARGEITPDVLPRALRRAFSAAVRKGVVMELNLHHIGGRWGTIPPIDTWGKFFGMLNITLYEPDDRSYQQIQRLDMKKTRGYKSVGLVPLCIGSEDSESNLHLCFDRNASSIHLASSKEEYFKYAKALYAEGPRRKAQREKLRAITTGSILCDNKL